MADTSSPTPARFANSSMHSVWISVESISKQMSLRIRRYISSRCNEKSMAISLDNFMKAACISEWFLGSPRSENSMQALTLFSGCFRLMRPVRRLIPSIFIPCFVMMLVAAAMLRAERLRPSTMRIYLFFPWRFTQSSYSSLLMGEKPTLTPSSVALNRASFITCPECSSSIRMSNPSERVLWMSAWPISSTCASYFDRILVKEAVRPGWSWPVILIRICSIFLLLSAIM